MSPWSKRTLITEAGEAVEAICPVIISASRSTDIPGCYADWFVHRFLDKGYLVWMNPFDRRPTYVAFDKVRAIVFWTKDPGPMFPYLDRLDERGVNYYFQFTLNDYEDKGYEPNVPPLRARVRTFLELSERIGKGRVVWRFDPVVLAEGLGPNSILERMQRIGDMVHAHTERMVISFVDLRAYRRLAARAGKAGIREPSREEMERIASGLAEMNEDWGLELMTCGEEVSLAKYGVRRGRCIDGDLLLSLFPEDKELARFLERHNRKDRGQRKACGCIESKDIGGYSTCPHLCEYCYANASRELVIKNVASHDRERYGETITGAVPAFNNERTRQTRLSV